LDETDRDLADRFVRHGDEDAFRALFRRHTPRLYAMAVRLVGGRTADAEDVVQEAWQRAASRLDRFEWRSALGTWLAAIVINCARERLRVRDDRHGSTADEPDPPAPTGAPAASIDLERAIAALPSRARQVFVMHDVEGYTHAEIAGLLDIAAGTSKSELFLARRRMRTHLAAARPETR
jgi:RNA polymerase sigma-70 factor (ECF subfamily)